MKNNYLYQGNYAEYDEDIGWHDFALRSYDAQLGRFWQTDPYDEFASGYTGMGNDPVNMVDPSGGWSLGGLISGITGSSNVLFNTAALAAGGALIGGIVDFATGGDGRGALIGAGIGAGIGLASGINWGSAGSALGQAAPSIAVQGARVAADVITQTQPNPYAQWAGYSPQPQLPPFSTLLSNYPLPYEHRPDRTPINPKLPLDDVTGANFLYFNQCAIRMSITLRKSGVNLSGVKNITNPGGQTYASGNVIGATNLAGFLLKYGKPQVFDGTKDNIASALKNKTGIIYFQGYNENYGTTLPEERSNGNVHIDLWNNDTIMAPYLQQMLDAKRVLFWETK